MEIIKSDQINDIATALCQFQADCPALELDREVEVKTKSGGTYRFKYSTLLNIVETTRPILHANGLSVTQLPNIDGSVTTILLHKSGQFLSSTLHIKGGNTPQEMGSIITYTKRYALASMLGLVSEEDDDANIGSGNDFTAQDKQINNLPWLNENTKEYDGAVKKLQSGLTTVDKIKTVMRLSKTTEAKLKEVKIINGAKQVSQN